MMEQGEAKLHELLDREAIRDVYSRYARGIDRADRALLASAYHADAVEDHHGETLSGAAIGESLVSHALKSMQHTSTHITNLSIAVHGDKAGCEAYYIGAHILAGGDKRVLSSGRTFDRLERRGGEWRFVHRIIAPDMVRVMPFDEVKVSAGHVERGPGDPSYEVLRWGASS
jgi:ketosteroid isomerase-like protein